MTCVIATVDTVLAKELRGLVILAGLTVVDSAADLLLLDIDADITAPVCGKTIRFSRSTESGADFVRPFSYRKLLSALQRQHSEYAADTSPRQTYFSTEGFTATEKRLLDALIAADGAPVSSAELALAAFGDAQCHNELKVYIRHLRKKIEEPQGVRVIETVRGVGYLFRTDRVLNTQYTDYTGVDNHGS